MVEPKEEIARFEERFESNLNTAEREKFRKTLFYHARFAAASVDAPGAATLLLAFFDLHSKTVQYLNIGNSTLLIIRKLEIVVKSGHSMNAWNDPMSIAKDKMPKGGLNGNFPLEHKDIVIVGTKGFFKNTSDIEILEVVNRVMMRKMQLCLTRLMDVACMAKLSELMTLELIQTAHQNSMENGRPEDMSIFCILMADEPRRCNS